MGLNRAKVWLAFLALHSYIKPKFSYMDKTTHFNIDKNKLVFIDTHDSTSNLKDTTRGLIFLTLNYHKSVITY